MSEENIQLNTSSDASQNPARGGKAKVESIARPRSRMAGPLPSSDIAENVHLEEPLSARGNTTPSHGTPTKNAKPTESRDLSKQSSADVDPKRTDSVIGNPPKSVSTAVCGAVRDVGAAIVNTASKVGEKVQTIGPYESPASVAPSDVDPLAMAMLGAEKEKEDATW
ncbi:hypothetical protein NA57DRAFT_73623 [Rhizodiscina lignyota]|uniref:Uncharacterized protein n=1 Tax=Rhizodiscina lignyota TaxID=1504668 RepID=A0A9P4M8Z5_9PEZI|nr:hypothetical protein NA57DRAFT_73623 [Rhizodiscina lignyota]